MVWLSLQNVKGALYVSNDPGNGMFESLHRIALELLKAAGHILVELGLSVLLLGAGTLLVLATVSLLSAYITPVGILAGFMAITPITYLYVRSIRGQPSE